MPGDVPSRRDFLLAAGSSLATGMVLSGCGDERSFDLNKPPVPGGEGRPLGEEKWISTVCGQCPAGCGIRARIVEGRLVKVEGQPSCPVNRGGVGPRGLAAPQVLYDPDRIQQPLRRNGPRGSGEWEPISWEEALETLATRLTGLRETNETHRLAVICGKERGMMRDLWQRFAGTFGTPNFFDGRSKEGGAIATANRLMQGIDEIPAYDWAATRYVLSLGSGILDSSCQNVYFARAQAHLRRGSSGARSKVVHVGSYRSLTAINADEWIRIHPGTHGAFALAIAHVLVRDGHYDQEFIDEHCFGFERWADGDGVEHRGFREFLTTSTPEAAAATCGTTVKKIEGTAAELAQNPPAFAFVGPQATLASNGLSTAMSIHALNALLGAIDRPGGLLTPRPAPLDDWPEWEPDQIAESGLQKPRLDGVGSDRFPLAGSVLEALPEALTAGEPYSLDTLLVYYSNPLYARIDPARWRRALDAVPFVASFSPFMDETSTEVADLVLPDSTFLERWEDGSPAPSVGASIFGIRQPVVETLYDTRATGDVVIELAQALGDEIAESFPWKNFKAALLKRIIGIHKAKRGSIVESKGSAFLKRLYTEGYWSDQSYEYGQWEEVLKTSSGKFEFAPQALWSALASCAQSSDQSVDELLLSWGYFDPDAVCLPHYEEIRWRGDAVRYPLTLIPFKPNTYAEGSGANLPWLQELGLYNGRSHWETEAEVHPDTAATAGIRDGDFVHMESPAGKIQCRVRLSKAMARDAIAVPQGGGHTAFGRWAEGWGANVMTLLGPEHLDPFLGIAPLGGAQVAIRKVEA